MGDTAHHLTKREAGCGVIHGPLSSWCVKLQPPGRHFAKDGVVMSALGNPPLVTLRRCPPNPKPSLGCGFPLPRLLQAPYHK